MPQPPPEAYEKAVEALLSIAAEDLRRSDTPQTRRAALCRYLKRGRTAGFSSGELVDFLGISTPSVLDRAGFSEEDAEETMRVLAGITDDEIDA